MTETEVTVTDETPPPESGDTVVVAGGPDPANSEAVGLEIGTQLGSLTTAVDTMAGVVSGLVTRVDDIANRLDFTAETASEAFGQAIEATETAETAAVVAEGAAIDAAHDETPEIEPDREHWVWRNPFGRRNKGTE